MCTSREACSGWGAVELSFLGLTLQVSTHTPETCTEHDVTVVDLPRLGSSDVTPVRPERARRRQRGPAALSRSPTIVGRERHNAVLAGGPHGPEGAADIALQEPHVPRSASWFVCAWRTVTSTSSLSTASPAQRHLAPGASPDHEGARRSRSRATAAESLRWPRPTRTRAVRFPSAGFGSPARRAAKHGVATAEALVGAPVAGSRVLRGSGEGVVLERPAVEPPAASGQDPDLEAVDVAARAGGPA